MRRSAKNSRDQKTIIRSDELPKGCAVLTLQHGTPIDEFQKMYGEGEVAIYESHIGTIVRSHTKPEMGDE